jgi:hypothetical protein
MWLRIYEKKSSFMVGCHLTLVGMIIIPLEGKTWHLEEPPLWGIHFCTWMCLRDFVIA